MDEITVETRRIYDGRVVSLRVDTVKMPNGRPATREIVEHPGAVAIVPVLGESIVMVRQFRCPVNEVLLEIPAGTLRRGEDPADCAARELIEETNFKAETLTKLLFAYLAPGYSEEAMHFYLATGLTPCQGQQDEDENVEVELLPVSEVMEAIRAGRVRDAKSVAGLLVALDLLRRSPDPTRTTSA